jgi:transcriptional regulator with XRE-family HTH domain
MFYDTFLKLCNQTGKTPTTVGREIGINKTTISFWKNGRSEPSDRTIMKVADHFKVDYRALKEGRIVPIYAPIEEKPMMFQEEIEVYDATSKNQESIKRSAEFAIKYSQLDDRQKALVSELIDTLLEKRK